MSLTSAVGGSENFGFEALAVAVNKKAVDQQGKAALAMLEGAVESVQQVQAAAPRAVGNVGNNVNTYA